MGQLLEESCWIEQTVPHPLPVNAEHCPYLPNNWPTIFKWHR